MCSSAILPKQRAPQAAPAPPPPPPPPVPAPPPPEPAQANISPEQSRSSTPPGAKGSRKSSPSARRKRGKQSLKIELGGASSGGAGLNIPQ